MLQMEISFYDPPYGFFQMASSSFDNRYKELISMAYTSYLQGDLSMVPENVDLMELFSH